MDSLILFILAIGIKVIDCSTMFGNKHFDCGPYGFTCESNTKVRLCDADTLFGPTFLCPINTYCHEDSNEVCVQTFNYIEPGLSRTMTCRRKERIADPSVPGCKGYILCIPNKNRFQGIKFKCGGNTIFNGVTRTCSAPVNYKCPLTNTTNTRHNVLYKEDTSNRRMDTYDHQLNNHRASTKPRPIDCKNYKFTITQDGSPNRATYFCPPKPVYGEKNTICTVFSNKFCITLEKDEPDQFALGAGIAYRRPRKELS